MSLNSISNLGLLARRICGAGISLLLAVGTVGNVWADEASSLQLKGFGTLAATYTGESGTEFVRDLGQPSGVEDGVSFGVDSRLGLQLNWTATSQTEAVVQAVAQKREDGSFTPELTWAYLRHEFSPELEMRVGRLGTEFFMLADSRDVGYSYLTVRPSVDYYGTLVFSHVDGIDATFTHPLGNGLVKAKLGAGISPEEAPIIPGVTWDLAGTLIAGGYVDFLQGPWQMRFSHVGMRFANEMPWDTMHTTLGILAPPNFASVVPEMSLKGEWAKYSSVGLAYDDGPLALQLQLNRIDHTGAAYESSKAAYLQASYRLGSVTPYVGYGRVFSNNTPITGYGPLDPLIALHQSQSHTDQYTYTLGARWDFRPGMALKAQIDHIEGDPSSIYLFRGSIPKVWDGDMTVFSLALDFVF